MKNYTKPTCELVRYKVVDGFEDYLVTENGDVWSIKSKKFLKPDNIKGHYRVTFSVNGETTRKFVHILVAEAFVPKPQTDKPLDVHHLDHNPTNNCASNLVWLTRSQHFTIHYGRPIRCLENSKIYASQLEAARDLGLNRSSIGHCARGDRSHTGGYHFVFVDEE